MESWRQTGRSPKFDNHHTVATLCIGVIGRHCQSKKFRISSSVFFTVFAIRRRNFRPDHIQFYQSEIQCAAKVFKFTIRRDSQDRNRR